MVVASQLATDRHQATASIHTIRHRGIPVFYAGNTFEQAATRRQVPGVYLGTKLHPAATLIAAILQKADP